MKLIGCEQFFELTRRPVETSAKPALAKGSAFLQYFAEFAEHPIFDSCYATIAGEMTPSWTPDDPS